MSQGLLVINAGSSSIKFSVFAVSESDNHLSLVCRGAQESIGEENPHFKATDHTGKVLIDTYPLSRSNHDRSVNPGADGEVYNHQAALRDLLNWLRGRPDLPKVVAAGHRVVHGGQQFSDPQRLTPEVIAQLTTFIPLAPLHQPHNLAGIHALTAVRPDLPQVGCFDTAFHHSQSELARLFALPLVYRQEGVQRYGFHGLSYEYIAGDLAARMGTSTTGRVVVAHLGNGASLCAMRNGKSVTTTMGFSTIDGIPMGTRSGALDPGVLLYLLEQHGMGLPELNKLLYKQSGLLGLSGISNDMRELLASADPNAKLAVDYFIYRIVCEIGSLTAALGGLDALVFTGGIGEHATAVRERVCARLNWLGLELDAAANAASNSRIDRAGSQIAVWVIPTNEELVIARHTRNLVLA